MDEFTFCSGAWFVEGAKKRDRDFYMKWLEPGLGLIAGRNLFFFYEEEELADRVSDMASHHGIALHLHHLPLHDMHAYQYADAFLAACKRMGLDALPRQKSNGRDKGLNHYWRDYKASGEQAYREITSIWVNKIFMMAKIAASLNPFESRELIWIDAAIARLVKRRKITDMFDAKPSPMKITHYESRMQYFGRSLPIAAAYLQGEPDAWSALGELYGEALENCLKLAYALDEEIVLSYCYDSFPYLFTSRGKYGGGD